MYQQNPSHLLIQWSRSNANITTQRLPNMACCASQENLDNNSKPIQQHSKQADARTYTKVHWSNSMSWLWMMKMLEGTGPHLSKTIPFSVIPSTLQKTKLSKFPCSKLGKEAHCTLAWPQFSASRVTFTFPSNATRPERRCAPSASSTCTLLKFWLTSEQLDPR